MAVKAQWHLAAMAELPKRTSDPFADDEPVHVPTVGIRVDVTPGDTLDKRLADLIETESNLFKMGIQCEIKDCVGATCFACPLYAGDNPADPLAPLCLLGREQQTVLTLLAVRKRGRGR